MNLSDRRTGEQKNLNRAEASQPLTTTSTIPVGGIWRTIRGYILWSYERGSIQYDVMVTLILLFVFLSPIWINFKDKPIEYNPHQAGVAVSPDGQGGFIYQIEGHAIQAEGDLAIRAQLLKIIEPISGEVSITKYEAVKDHAGNVVFYKVWASRE
jgi:hypothetical protein